MQSRHWVFESLPRNTFPNFWSSLFPFKSILVFACLLFCKTNTIFLTSFIHTINETKSNWIWKFRSLFKILLDISSSVVVMQGIIYTLLENLKLSPKTQFSWKITKLWNWIFVPKIESFRIWIVKIEQFLKIFENFLILYLHKITIFRRENS